MHVHFREPGLEYKETVGERGGGGGRRRLHLGGLHGQHRAGERQPFGDRSHPGARRGGRARAGSTRWRPPRGEWEANASPSSGRCSAPERSRCPTTVSRSRIRRSCAGALAYARHFDLPVIGALRNARAHRGRGHARGGAVHRDRPARNSAGVGVHRRGAQSRPRRDDGVPDSHRPRVHRGVARRGAARSRAGGAGNGRGDPAPPAPDRGKRRSGTPRAPR